jgi:hypothetical protein
MAKYKPGQTWPVGAFKSGLMLMFSDKELREGHEVYRDVKVRKPDRMVKRGEETPHDFTRVLKKVRTYPAGKPLKTDTAIRRFRQKHIFGKVGKWKIRKWRE